MEAKRGRGRPPKKNHFALNIQDPNINNNKTNIIPASLISRQYIKLDPLPNCSFFLITNHAMSWKTLFEVLKDNQSYVILTIDETGLTFSNDNVEDIKAISAKLFPDKMIEFRVSKKMELRIDVSEFYKIIKTIPNNGTFTIFLEKVEDEQYSNLVVKLFDHDNNRQKTYSLQIQETNVNGQNKVATDNGLAAQYDIIAMLNAADFHRDCKNMKVFSDNFEISYSNKILTFMFISNNKIVHLNEMEESKALEFVKRAEDVSVSQRYALDSFFKYTKCAKFSSTVKLYLTKDTRLPGILEYDINPQLGTFQIFIQSV